MELPYHNTEMKHWNPGASMPLILPVHLICNTPDEDIYANIRANSHAHGDWIAMHPAHGLPAIICGSGPSLADCIGEIRERRAQGGIIFALNGSAAFLHEHGIMPDYQVIIDARKETAALVGPARTHLFASQVHPDCFRRAPDARLWHLQVGNIEACFPDYEDGYALVGGAASVGNTTLCLAYVLGFRDLHCYGYDSSHRDGRGHAFAQPLNDGDPCAVVNFNGRQYVSSLTMKLQAERFVDTATALELENVSIAVHGSGLLPDIWARRNELPESELEQFERDKYEAMWQNPDYRKYAPGEFHAEQAIDLMPVKSGESVIDFGIGTGRGAARLQRHGASVKGVDLARNCLDAGVSVHVYHAPLWAMPDITADHGFCTDVMEHIPEDKVSAVLSGIAVRVKDCYFNISTQPDVMGATIGRKLHLTVKPVSWWSAELRKHWNSVNVFDVGGGDLVAICRH